MSYIYEKYDSSSGSLQISNKDIVNKRAAERKKFINFHYALGGLLTYKKRYSCVKRLFNYTTSEPPRYELLPKSMDEIFKFYFELNDFYETQYSWMSHQFPFPGLNGLTADPVIKYWINSYMAILFLRQYTIIPYLVTMRPLDIPHIPNTQKEIKEWIDGLDYFKKLVKEHLENEIFLKDLHFDFITPRWCIEKQKPYPTNFIESFKSRLENAYTLNAFTLPISEKKVSQFENLTRMIIEPTFDKLLIINNETTILEDNVDKWYVNGERMLQSKDAFSENPEVHYIESDSYLASVVSENLNVGLGETFLYKRTKSYLLKAQDLFNAINRLEIDDSYVLIIFGISLDYLIENLKLPNLTKEKYKNANVYSFDGSRFVESSIFVIKKTELPQISTRPISEDIVTKYSLKKISNKINLYSSVIDLNNTSNEVFKENLLNKTEDELRKSVLLSIFIFTEFKWKKDIEIIELQQYSEYLQKGIVNNLDDIKAINRKKPYI